MPIPIRAEQPDTVRISSQQAPQSPSFLRPVSDSIDAVTQQFNSISSELPIYPTPLFSSEQSFKPQQQFKIPDFMTTAIAGWNGGQISMSGSERYFNGLSAIESGQIVLNQKFGALSLTAWAGAEKYGYYRGLQQSWTFGGKFHYDINDRWSATAFGEYHTPLHPLSPAMAEMMKSSRFGGYVSYNISDHWGVSVGAQATRSLVTNRWQAQPIVMPYYRINKSISVGVDVGGIIYNIAKDYIDSKRSGPPAVPASLHQPPRPSAPKFSPGR